ncbi:MAG TPA: hypothetical protein DD670_11045 [Planctomycetaceae bacterium]|nr:hypothetical protein [Planctomycetaceae bacterium]
MTDAACLESDECNPYAAPEEIRGGDEDDHRLSPFERQCLSAGRLFFFWEKLRIAYNVILGLEAAAILAVALSSGNSLGRIVVELVFAGVIANVCFCVGPVINCYVNWLGLRTRIVTWVLFVLGAGFAMFLGLTLLLVTGLEANAEFEGF